MMDAKDLSWLPKNSQELDAQKMVLLAEKDRLVKEKAKAGPKNQYEYDQKLTELKGRIEANRLARARTTDGLNSHFVCVVADALGPANNYVYRRIVDEAVSRLDGNPRQYINIYPDDMMDALTESKKLIERKNQAEAKVHAVRSTLEKSKLSMKGNLSMADYDRRKAFNDLIDNLLRQL